MATPDPVYAQPLRAIGQALEVLRVEAFDLESEGGDYLVRIKSGAGSSERNRQKNFQRSLVEQIWETVPPELDRSLGEPSETPASAVASLRYTPSDVDRLEQEGRSRRGYSGPAPDLHGVSKILRVIGDKLNRSEASGFSISCSGQSVSVAYRTRNSGQKIETFKVKALFDDAERIARRRSSN